MQPLIEEFFLATNVDTVDFKARNLNWKEMDIS